MERMVWAMVLMVGPAAALAQARFEWTETTSKECRTYFQQAYIDRPGHCRRKAWDVTTAVA